MYEGPRSVGAIGRLAVVVLFGMLAVHTAVKASRNYFYELAIATRAHDDDVFAHQLCTDPTIKAGLGRYSLCEEARVNVQLSPHWVAFWHAGGRLFHCGEASCVEWVADGLKALTASLYGLIFAVAMMAVVPVGLYMLCHGDVLLPALPIVRPHLLRLRTDKDQ